MAAVIARETFVISGEHLARGNDDRLLPFRGESGAYRCEWFSC